MLHHNLKTIRKNKRMSQEELAVRIHVVRQTVSKWEKGTSVPDSEMLIRIAEDLEVSVSELIGEEIPLGEEDKNEISRQLQRINEHLAVKNRTAKLIIVVAVSIGAVIMLILLFIILFSFSVSRIITTETHAISGQVSNLSDNVSDIAETLEEKERFLEKSEWSYVGYDPQKYRADIEFRVTIKEFTPEITEVFFIYEDKEVLMSYKNGEYTAKISTDIFQEQIEIDRIFLRENGVSRSEQPDWAAITPGYDCLPSIEGLIYSTGTRKMKKDGISCLRMSGRAKYSGEYSGIMKEMIWMEEACLVIEIDGEETERRELSLYNEGQGFAGEQYFDAYVPYGSTLTILIEVTDSGKMCHRETIGCIEVDENGGRKDG